MSRVIAKTWFPAKDRDTFESSTNVSQLWERGLHLPNPPPQDISFVIEKPYISNQDVDRLHIHHRSFSEPVQAQPALTDTAQSGFRGPAPMQQIAAKSVAQSCSNDAADTVLSVSDRNLDYIEEQQEDLRDARDDLIGARFRLKDQRKDMRAVREIAVSQIAKAHDLMRRFILSQNLDPPAEVSAVWSKVENLRDRLGEKEADYDEAENEYDLQEWKYTEKEQKFVDHIFNTKTESSESSDDPPVIEHDTKLRQFSDGPTYHDSGLSDLEDDIHDIFSDPDLLVGVSQPEIPIAIPQYVAVNVESSTQVPVSATNIGPLTPNRQKVSSWMLHCLRTSPFQRRLLELFLPANALDKRDWWEKVLKYWDTEEFQTVTFHTGDTTISDSTFSQAVLIDLGEASHHVSEEADLAEKSLPVVPMYCQGNSIYASDPVELPSRIKSKDLMDFPRHVHFHTQTHPSRTGPERVEEIAPEVPKACNPDSPGMASRDNQITAVREPSNQPDQAQLPHSYTVAANDGRLEVSKFIYDARKPINTGSNMSDGTYSIVSEQETQEVPSAVTNQSDQIYPASKFWTRYPFASFVRVQGQKSWSLPLLRLTPLPRSTNVHQSTCNGYNRVDEIPFVQLDDTPIRLPGPS